MSHSRSPTPTPNPPNPAQLSSTEHSLQLFPASRQEIHETNPPETRRTLYPPFFSTSEQPDVATGAPSSSRRGEKRMRSESEERSEEGHGEGRGSSSSASSSQGDMADTELEGGPSGKSERSPSSAPPTKKKRTRTLTTPHQSAVLHALLAQSRFPTTAMREEVGRQIGLSARKVQIWFQNQRQKAKRPRSQGAPPLSRPPQYGPFPNTPDLAPAGMATSYPLSGMGYSGEGRNTSDPGPSSASSTGSEQFSYRAAYGTEFSAMGSGTQLSGPGVPGTSATYAPSVSPVRGRQYSVRPQYPSQISMPQGSASSSLQRSAPEYLGRSVGFNYPFSRSSRGSSGDSVHSGDHPLTLPPLAMDRPHPRGNFPPPGPIVPHSLSRHGRHPNSAPSTVNAFALSHPGVSPVESPFAHQLPDARPTLTLPPPFTLQPQPQWDQTMFSPLSGPGSSSFPTMNRPSSSYEQDDPFRRFTFDQPTRQRPDVSHREGEESSNGDSTPQPQQRHNRFDPIRSSVRSYRPFPQAPPSSRYRSPERELEDEPSHE